MRVYRERLGVPFSWWLVTTACVLLLGTTLWAGLSVTIGVATYAGLELACALVLVGWGAVTIEVTERDLRAGSKRLPLGRITEVAVLDAAQSRALRGPRADPAAYLLIRPYLPASVYVEVTGQPYWLIATRKPTELAAAIERARSAATAAGHAGDGPVARGPAGACDDGAGDCAERSRAAKPVQAATHGKDGDAC